MFDVYHDARADGDCSDYPAPRNGACINCGSPWRDHNGWSCLQSGAENFHDVDPKYRYLTLTMLQHLPKRELSGHAPDYALNLPASAFDGRDPLKAEVPFDAWSSVRVGECPCGIARVRCSYHRDDTTR